MRMNFVLSEVATGLRRNLTMTIAMIMTTAISLETSKGDLPLALGLGLILVAVVFLINAAAQIIKTAAIRRYG